MNEDTDQNVAAAGPGDARDLMKRSLLATVGIMWTIGGIVAIFGLFEMHWLLGWLSAFVWLWGCIAAVLFFDLKRFINF